MRAVDQAQVSHSDGNSSAQSKCAPGSASPTRRAFAQLATEALLDLFQLLAQDLLQLRLARHLLALGEADQHRQRRLQGVTEVAQGVARTLQGLPRCVPAGG